MKFVDFTRECQEICAPLSSMWKEVGYHLTSEELVFTAREAGRRTNSRQEIGRYTLPERVVELPTPSWAYNKASVEAWDAERSDLVRGSLLANKGLLGTNDWGSILMFASEARRALEEFQRQAIALIDI